LTSKTFSNDLLLDRSYGHAPGAQSVFNELDRRMKHTDKATLPPFADHPGRATSKRFWANTRQLTTSLTDQWPARQ